MPAVGVMSLIATGRPWSGPSGSFFITAFSASARGVARLLGGQRDDGIELRIDGLDHREMGIEHLDRADGALANEPRQFTRRFACES